MPMPRTGGHEGTQRAGAALWPGRVTLPSQAGESGGNERCGSACRAPGCGGGQLCWCIATAAGLCCTLCKLDTPLRPLPHPLWSRLCSEACTAASAAAGTAASAALQHPPSRCLRSRCLPSSRVLPRPACQASALPLARPLRSRRQRPSRAAAAPQPAHSSSCAILRCLPSGSSGCCRHGCQALPSPSQPLPAMAGASAWASLWPARSSAGRASSPHCSTAA